MDSPIERFKAILTEWKKFISGDPINDTIISETILDLWIRSEKFGINPYLKKIPDVLEKNELQRLRKNNKELINISLPVLENLIDFVQGSKFICVLCDPSPYILEEVGDEDIMQSVKRGNFAPGAYVGEDSIGPNGIGTALRLDRPVQIFACEHYCISFHKWTCSGAPIHSPDGQIIGAINMTGPYLEANPHTLGMIVAAAHAIENLFHMQKAFLQSQLAEKLQKTAIESIIEAFIVLDDKDHIILINKNAERTLDLSPDKVLGKDIKRVFGKENKGFLNMINNNTPIIDAEVRIFHNNGWSDYTLTSNPILSPNKHSSGKVIVLNEIKRAKNLITKMTGAQANFQYGDIIGKNSNFLDTLNLARIASKSTSNVLLLGESGTGKDIFAQAIHNNSDRSDGPYVAINCAAIPRDLIPSELFGYAEGAFTGSRRGGSVGKFELADGGTLLLDEIGEMPLELQTSLLRVIEEKSVTRIGGKKPRSVDVRIIAATNKDLKNEVERGNFRNDLYYRLNVFSIKLLPLRERKDDIPYLTEYFVNNISKKMGKKIDKIDPGVYEILINYSWPGNIRELQNVIERAINIAPANELTVNLFPSEITHDSTMPEHNKDVSSLEDLERQMMFKMSQSNLSKTEMAARLKISRSTLYRKLEKYNIL
ncbi:MAG: sigma 54-interacting transcriptional regulator [Deltaproteobacteria bacterium]|nr:sigma 54-interacting transcriptional regulator [Deltaproteobacteria bacterium]